MSAGFSLSLDRKYLVPWVLIKTIVLKGLWHSPSFQFYNLAHLAWGQIFPVKIKIKRHWDFCVRVHSSTAHWTVDSHGFFSPPSFANTLSDTLYTPLLSLILLHRSMLDPCFCSPSESLPLLPSSVDLLSAFELSGVPHSSTLPWLLDLLSLSQRIISVLWGKCPRR